MITTLIVAAVLLTVSVLAGIAAARNGPEAGKCAGPVPMRQRAAWFLAGFFGWPCLAAFLVFLFVCCWPFIFTSEEDIAELEEMLSN